MPKPSNSHLISRLRQLALHSPPETSLFYARIWHALFPSIETDHESLHTLAMCFLQCGQPYSAIHLVRDLADEDPTPSGRLPSLKRGIPQRRKGCYGCAMIVGKCCEKLGRYSEGKAVVERAIMRSAPMAIPTPSPASTSASAFLMLGNMTVKGKEPMQAVDAYVKALQDDPWLWEAFTGLCDSGYPPGPEYIFPDPPASTRLASSRTLRQPISPNPMPRNSASEVPAMPIRKQLSPKSNGNGLSLSGSTGFFTPDAINGAIPPRQGMMPTTTTWDSPSVPADSTFANYDDYRVPPPFRTTSRGIPNIISAFLPGARGHSAQMREMGTPANPETVTNKPPAMKRPRGGNGLKKSGDMPLNGGLPMKPNGRDLKSIEPNGEEGQPVRRSSRLKSTSVTAPLTKVNSRETRTTRSRSATSSASGATIENPSSPQTQELQLQAVADDWLRDIVRKCARAYRALSMYACQEAIRELDTLPSEIQSTPWALEMVARSFYEMAEYVLARRGYHALLEREPYRLQSMETYSTLLWHLADAPALSALSQNLIAVDREAPQPWIAAGNCFSLQKDHDEAMRCFRRATQVDPECAYAWTLCGYEAVEMEEYERAIAFYRTAIRTDPRHYNAWYGMGLVYLKTGKPKYAEHHFRRAAEINPTNAVLLCCVGMVLEQSDDMVQALKFYDQACSFAPNSPMVAYKRIRVLVATQRIDEAVTMLEALVRTTPDEANIQLLLGKCYLHQGRRADATVAFTSARDLQPKLESAIKVAMGGGEEDDDVQEDADM